MNKFLIISCVFIWLINIFDYISTIIILDKDAIEMNPIINYLMGIIGIQTTMLLTKIPFLLLILYLTIKGIKKQLTKRESTLLVKCFSLVILVYTYCMYSYNLKSLLL